MLFIYLLSLFALAVQSVFVVTSIAAGLYYLAELVEEYTVMAKYIITWMVIAMVDVLLLLTVGYPNWFWQMAMYKPILESRDVVTAGIHIGLLIFEDLPLHLNALGLFQQFLHAVLLRSFPSVRVTSVSFIAALVNLVAHHYMAFAYFGTVYYSFMEVLAYFTLCLWAVPFGLFVSLSANDYVLPTTGEKQPLLGDNNVVTDYLSRKAKRYSLLTFFSFAKDSILPQRSKKVF